MPKEKHAKYGEKKEASLQVRLTQSAKAGLTELASQLNISTSELIERLGRGELKVTPSLGE